MNTRIPNLNFVALCLFTGDNFIIHGPVTGPLLIPKAKHRTSPSLVGLGGTEWNTSLDQ